MHRTHLTRSAYSPLTLELLAAVAALLFSLSLTSPGPAQGGVPVTLTGLPVRASDVRFGLTCSNPNNPSINSYQHHLRADGGTTWFPDWTDIAGSCAATTSHTVAALQSGDAYTVEVRAVGNRGRRMALCPVAARGPPRRVRRRRNSTTSSPQPDPQPGPR